MSFHPAGRAVRSQKVCVRLNRALLAGTASLALILGSSPGFAASFPYAGANDGAHASTTGTITVTKATGSSYTDNGANSELDTIMAPANSSTAGDSNLTASGLTINNTVGGLNHAALFNTFGLGNNTGDTPSTFNLTGTNSITDTEVTASGGLGAAFYGLQTDTVGTNGTSIQLRSSGTTSFTGNTGIYINNLGGSIGFNNAGSTDTINPIAGSTGNGIDLRISNYGNMFVVNQATETAAFGGYGMNLVMGSGASGVVWVSNSGALMGATGAINATNTTGDIVLGYNQAFTTVSGLTGAMTGGITATTSGGNITIVTATGGTINTSTAYGIRTQVTSGSGAVNITVGDKIGATLTPSSAGISADTSAGSGGITVAANANISGTTYGIAVLSSGAAANNITEASGAVITGGSYGINALGGADTLSLAGEVAGNILLSTGKTNSLTLTSSATTTDGVVTGTIDGGSTSTTALILNGSSSTITQDISKLANIATITESGTGTWTLLNTIVGGNPNYTVSSGTLQIGNGTTNAAIGTGTISDNATLVFDPNTGSSYSNSISGTGAVTITGSSTTTFTVGGGYSGATTINNGATLALFGTGAISSSSGVADSGTFDISNVNATASIISLSGSGTAALGVQTLNLTNAAGTFSGNITGALGAVFQVTAGNEILTGNSSAYAGNINIVSGGKITLGSGTSIPTLGTGTITDAGTLALGYTSGTGTYSNVISGAGALNVGSGGIMVLTGNSSSFSGTVSIASGTLQIGSGGSSGSLGTAAITNASALAFNVTGSNTISNAIGGAGSVTVMTGTDTFAGANNYTGTTSITGGTLVAGSASALGNTAGVSISSGGTLDINGNAITATDLSGAGTVTNNGGAAATLTVPGSTAFSGAITDGSKSTALTTTGTTLLFLTGANTYSGATTIVAGGQINVGNGGATGTLGSGAIADAGTLTLNRSNATTMANAISGGGAINVITGNVTLTGNGSPFSGTTTISSGAILAFGAGGSLGGTLVNNGLFGFNQSGTVTLNSVAGISGTGGLIQEGSGTLIVNTAIPFTGTSSVTAGILEVGDINTPSASLAGGVNVASGGTLEGHGTINGGVIVASGGTLRPGGTIGTLTLAGGASIPAGATFTEEFSNSAASKLVAGDSVTLGGNLVLVSDSASYTSGTDYKFITSTVGVTGTFASTSGSITGYTTNIQYSAKAVDLIITSTTPTPSATPTPTSTPTTSSTATITTFLFNTYGKTPNQIAAGTALTNSAFNAPLYVAVGNVVTANTAAVPTTLGQLAGDMHPSLRSATIEDARMVRDAMLGHMDRDPDGPILWAAGFGNFGNISDTNAANLAHRSGGFLVGGDLPIAATNNDLRLGLSVGYGTDKATTTGNLSTASGHETHVGAYITYAADAVHFDIGDDYGFGRVNIARNVGTLGAVLADNQGQHSNQTFAELSYHAPWDLPVDPYLGIAKVSSGQGAFTETGGIAALSGAAASDSEAFTTLGLRSDLGDPMSWGDASVTPHIDLGWQHAFQKLTPSQTVTFQSTGQSFLVLGVPLSNDAAKVKAGIEIKDGPATLFLDYDGEFANRVTENGISGGIDWQF